MPSTPCTAFLQSSVGRLPSRAGTAIRLLPGTKTGAWRIVGPRQAGSRSDTYPIVHEREGVLAALTVFDTPAVALASYTRRILETAQILTAIEHPGVVSIVDAGLVADGRPYVVTEAHRGMPLEERIADDRLDPADAIAIVRAICEPLIAAHEMGVVHGSLTLEHVFLLNFDDSSVKLLDWGVERAILDEARRAGIDVPAQVYPTAPEASLGILSTKVDAYALGVLAYQLLLGCLPFEADTQVGIRLLQEHAAPDPRALWPAIPPALETLLCELLAVDPRARPSIRSTADRLAIIARELAPPPELALIAEPPPRIDARSRFNPRIAAAVTTTVLLAALAMNVATDTDEVVTMASPRSQAVQPEIIAAPTTPPVATIAAPAVVVAPPRVSAPATTSAAASVAVAPPPAPPGRVASARSSEPRSHRVLARATASPPAKKPVATVRAKAAPIVGNHSSELLTQYQRIGHALLELRQARPTPATAEMWQQFQALKIQPALASATARASAAATLLELREKIERHKGISVSDACRANALADGCR